MGKNIKRKYRVKMDFLRFLKYKEKYMIFFSKKNAREKKPKSA